MNQQSKRLTLSRTELTEMTDSGNFNDDPYTVYKLTGSGEDWLLENQERLELRLQPKPAQKHVLDEGITDDQVPF